MFVWTKSSTKLLLEEYEKRKEDFRNPANTKKTLWADIKMEFEKYNYNIDTETLDKKFRNLKRTYLNIHDNHKKTGIRGGAVKWEFYNIFCKIFDSAITIENALSSISVDMENENKIRPIVTIDKDNDSANTSNDESEKAPKAINETTKTAKRKYGFWKDIFQLEKERLQETKKLRMSLDEMVEIQKERNKIFAQIAESLKK